MKRLLETPLDFRRNELDEKKSHYRRVKGEVENNSSLDDGLARHREAGVIIGVLVGFGESDLPVVDFPENKASEAVVARSTVPLSTNQIGSEVVLTFERGDLRKPIIFGCLLSRVHIEPTPVMKIEEEDQLVFSAQREIVLSCGKASITLTRAGKILILGAYLLSRSSGVNRIKGGSVQIN